MMPATSSGTIDMSDISYFSPNAPLGFRNRKGGLIAFGIILIVLGAMSGCLAIFMPVAFQIQQQQMRRISPATTLTATTSAVANDAFQFRVTLITMAIYVLVAGTFIWIGIGSVRARRWVRPIVLIIATLWLISGVIGTAAFVLSLSSMQAAMRAASPAAPAATTNIAYLVGAIIGGGVVLVLYIVLPALLLWFYRSSDVLRTVEFYDP